MGQFFILLRDFYSDILKLFGRSVLNFGNIQTSLGAVIFACITIGFVVSLYWKGAKT